MQSKTAVIFELNAKGGFYSVFFFLLEAYLYAKENQCDFYVTSTDWYYTHTNGWHDYFISLNAWDPMLKSTYETVIVTSHMKLPKERSKFTLRNYIDAIKIIYKLKPELEAKSDEILQKHPELISLFIRRGDKITFGEAPHIETSEIVRLTGLDNKTELFVQTDDYRVVEELETKQNFNKLISTVPKTKFGSHARLWLKLPKTERKIQTEEMLIGLQVCSKSQLCWTDFTSNVGRFLILSNIDNVKIYATDRPKPELNLDRACENPAFGF